MLGTFASSRTPATTGPPLSYLVMGQITDASHTRSFKQDALSALQQQYIDLDRRRWGSGSTTVPPRHVFKTSYSTAYYDFSDFAHGRSPILMYLGYTADRIYEIELKATGHKPRITSGYRYPKQCNGNSLHQFGWALDMNPARAINTDTKRREMLARIKHLLRNRPFDPLIHGPVPHIHLEYDP